jgi:GAF domain
MATQAHPLNTPQLQTCEVDVSKLERDLLHQELPRDFALSVIAEHARVLTHADGAAIALGREPAVCRARVGFAPSLGVELRPESGLSGECLRTGRIIHCPDTLKDPRVNTIAAGELTIRSVLVVPIKSKGQVSGLLEVFSFNPDCLDQQQAPVLLQLGDLVTKLNEHSRPKDIDVVVPLSNDSGADVRIRAAGSTALPLQRTQLRPSVEHERATPGAERAVIKRVTIAPPRLAMAAITILICLGVMVSWISRATFSRGNSATPQPRWGMLQPASTGEMTAKIVPSPQNGNIEYALGLKFKRGEGFPKNESQALNWFRQAAERGHADAEYELASAAASGRGMARDYVAAYTWYTLARVSGNAASERALNKLKRKMRKDQIHEAEQQAQTWLRTH